jgi:hypothetical protein
VRFATIAASICSPLPLLPLGLALVVSQAPDWLKNVAFYSAPLAARVHQLPIFSIDWSWRTVRMDVPAVELGDLLRARLLDWVVLVGVAVSENYMRERNYER